MKLLKRSQSNVKQRGGRNTTLSDSPGKTDLPSEVKVLALPCCPLTAKKALNTIHFALSAWDQPCFIVYHPASPLLAPTKDILFYDYAVHHGESPESTQTAGDSYSTSV